MKNLLLGFKNKNHNAISDIVYCMILSILSLILISFYFNANYLNTGYPDWVVHAFRVKALQNFGLSSWTHVWSNGTSLWKTYQFIPHVLTLGAVSLFHVSISRAMILMTIILFVSLRISIYSVLRLLKFSPLTAFVCSLLSFDIAQYWEGVSEYSLLFGFTVFPLILFIWVKYFEGKLQYAYPYIAGALFILHPLLGLVAMALLMIAVVFSERKIISLSIFLQFIIMLASSSLFWYPIVVKTAYAYTNQFYKTREFLNLILSSVDYFGLSLFLFFCFACCCIRIFMPISPKFQWTKTLFIFVVSYLLLIIVGTNIDLPAAINQFQFTRGVTFIGIALIFVFASVVEDAIKITSSAVKGLLLFLFSLAFIEGIWFTSIHSSYPAKRFEEPIMRFASQHKNSDILHSRVWTPTIDTSSYLTPDTVRLSYSYMPQLESNQIPQRLVQLAMYQPYIGDVPQSSLDRLDDYFRISGTKYIVLDETSPLTKAYLKQSKEYIDLGRVSLPHALYHVFLLPYPTRDSILVAKENKDIMQSFPLSLQFSQVNDQIELDNYVNKFVSALYKQDNTVLSISYPTPETLQVIIPANRINNMVYIDESYDSNWHAYFNNKKQHVSAVGPNYMLVTLDTFGDSGVLFLRHVWPISFYISCYLLMIIPLEIVLIVVMKKIFLKKNEPSFVRL